MSTKPEIYNFYEDAHNRDCVLCGAKESVEEKVNFTTVMLINEKEVSVGPFTGKFCTACGDGFLSKESEALFDLQVKGAENASDISV